MVIYISFWSISATKKCTKYSLGPLGCSILSIHVQKDVQRKQLSAQTKITSRPKLVTSTPETVCALNFDIEEQDEFSFLGSFSYTTGLLLSRSNGKS